MRSPGRVDEPLERVTVAASKTTLKPGDRIALTHGLRSQNAMRLAHRRLRAQKRSALLAIKPDLRRDELELAIDILVRLQQIREWVAKTGGSVTVRGQLRRGGVGEQESAAAQWDRWCRRNGVGYGTAKAESPLDQLADDQP